MFFSWNIIFCALTLIGIVSVGSAFNYCSYAARNFLCNESIHIVCKPSSVVSSERLLMLVPMTNSVRDKILAIHNEFRNQIAAGNISSEYGTYGPALAMREVIWDKEFAFIANVHASRCTVELDKCHSTMHIRNMTQLVGVSNASEIPDALKEIFQTWTNETDEPKLPITVRNSIYSKYLSQKAPRAMALMNDRTSRIGCGVSYCDFLGQYRYHLTCYYENSNEFDVDVFKAIGPKDERNCSIWQTELSTKYKFLCKNTGKIFPQFYPN